MPVHPDKCDTELPREKVEVTATFPDDSRIISVHSIFFYFGRKMSVLCYLIFELSNINRKCSIKCNMLTKHIYAVLRFKFDSIL